MENEKIMFSSKPIEISEFQDYKLATFMISVLDEWDLNGRMIPKEVGEKYHGSIVGFPIVAKLLYNPITGEPEDFGGHQVYIKTNKNGKKEVKFGTQPIGSVLSSWIEEREVEGYEGVKSCIMIQAKLWSTRYPEYFNVLDKLWENNEVSSSWELTLTEVENTLKGRIIKAFNFIGNCILGKNTMGAVPKAGVIDYAELNEDFELERALSKDMICFSEKIKEETQLVQIEQEETILAKGKEGKEPELSALTEYDLRSNIQKACRDKIDKWCWMTKHFPTAKTVWCEYEGSKTELDYLLFTYEVSEDDVVTVSEPTEVKLTVSIAEINKVIAEKDTELSAKETIISSKLTEIADKETLISTKDAALVSANEKIASLETEISTLIPFKQSCEEAEVKRIESEMAEKKEKLATKVKDSKLFTPDELESSEIKTLIDAIDEKEVNSLIAEKFMASLIKEKKEEKHETAEVEISTLKADIDNKDESTFSVKEMLSFK